MIRVTKVHKSVGGGRAFMWIIVQLHSLNLYDFTCSSATANRFMNFIYIVVTTILLVTTIIFSISTTFLWWCILEKFTVEKGIALLGKSKRPS